MSWKDFDYSKWKAEDDKFDHAALDKALDDANKNSGGQLEKWLELVADLPRPPFHPHACFNVHGNQIEVYLTNDPYYARWLSPQLSVHLDFETHEVIGLTISGITGMISRELEEEKKHANREPDSGESTKPTDEVP